MSSFKTADALQPYSLQWSSHYPKEVLKILLMLRMFRSVCSWGSQRLTNYHKTVQKEMSSDLLSCYKADGDSFLSWIVSGHETWIHHFELQTKGKSIEWHHPTSTWKKKKGYPFNKVGHGHYFLKGRMRDFGSHYAM
jgi:hypothetical protein